ncbi:hypothetical protein ROHU_029895 [Labeo rohita]|uniref:Uncharacterized protein n=1 Tax=Labeo rohita TaxID=84645 RepID=A0A498LX39_LABRO|nr:hypothetical protein ROHU_029895 [Labeo rohita]
MLMMDPPPRCPLTHLREDGRRPTDPSPQNPLVHLEREDIPDTGWTTAMLTLTLRWLLDSLLVRKRDAERSAEKNLCSPGLEYEESWT